VRWLPDKSDVWWGTQQDTASKGARDEAWRWTSGRRDRVWGEASRAEGGHAIEHGGCAYIRIPSWLLKPTPGYVKKCNHIRRSFARFIFMCL
jgi:hypothetical protein